MTEEDARRTYRSELQMRWVPLEDAAAMLGISAVAVRKQISGRKLTALRAGRGWRVLLPAADAPRDSGYGESRVRARAADGGRDGAVEAQGKTPELLAELVRDLQKQSLALAAQVGYLQNQVAEAQERMKQLEQRDSPLGVVSEQGNETERREIEELRKSVALYQAELSRSQREPVRRSFLKRLFRR